MYSYQRLLIKLSLLWVGTFRVGPSSKLQRVEGRRGKVGEERGGEGREGEGCGLTDDVEFSYSSTVVTYENSVW